MGSRKMNNNVYICFSFLPQNPMRSDLNPRGFLTKVIGGAIRQKLSPGILATYLCRRTAAAEWIFNSRGSINISPEWTLKPEIAGKEWLWTDG